MDVFTFDTSYHESLATTVIIWTLSFIQLLFADFQRPHWPHFQRVLVTYAKSRLLCRVMSANKGQDSWQENLSQGSIPSLSPTYLSLTINMTHDQRNLWNYNTYDYIGLSIPCQRKTIECFPYLFINSVLSISILSFL